MSRFLLQPVEIFWVLLLEEQFYKHTFLKVSQTVRANLEQTEAEVQYSITDIKNKR